MASVLGKLLWFCNQSIFIFILFLLFCFVFVFVLFWCVFSVRTREEKGCGYRTTPARQKGTAVLSPRGLGRHTESPQGAKRSETKFTPEGVPVKIYTRVSSQTKWVRGKRRSRLQHFDDHTYTYVYDLKPSLPPRGSQWRFTHGCHRRQIPVSDER